MFQYERTAGDASRIKSVALNLLGCHFWTLSAQRRLCQINLFGKNAGEEVVDVIWGWENCSDKMTCHFKCQPYCLDFPDNCSIRISGKHRAIIRECVSGHWCQQSASCRQSQSHYCTSDISGNTPSSCTIVGQEQKWYIQSRSFFSSMLVYSRGGPGALIRHPHALSSSAAWGQREPASPQNTGCTWGGNIFPLTEWLWMARRHVSGVSLPLTEESEMFQHSDCVMKLSGLLPGQSDVATAHELHELFLELDRFAHVQRQGC